MKSKRLIIALNVIFLIFLNITIAKSQAEFHLAYNALMQDSSVKEYLSYCTDKKLLIIVNSKTESFGSQSHYGNNFISDLLKINCDSLNYKELNEYKAKADSFLDNRFSSKEYNTPKITNFISQAPDNLDTNTSLFYLRFTNLVDNYLEAEISFCDPYYFDDKCGVYSSSNCRSMNRFGILIVIMRIENGKVIVIDNSRLFS